MYTEKEIEAIAGEFRVDSPVRSVAPLGSGLINDTFKVTTEENRHYALQRINNAIFQDVELLQHNIEAVTAHIRKKLTEKGEPDIDRKVLTFIPLKDSAKTYLIDPKGGYWRMSAFIEGSRNIDEVNEESSRLAGQAFGQFEAMLTDLPEKIGETIPDFHNMPLRLRQLREAVAADPKGRAGEVRDLLDLTETYAEKMCSAEKLHAEGKLPKRICHCDTKVGNVLFDAEGKVLCVIDLDTVMPSFVFSDFGDFMRTAANPVPEDSPEYEKIDLKMDIFKAFTEGYLSTAEFLTPLEKEMLPYAVELFAFMQAVRFLCDYINGDTYYKIQYPEHNLVRARNQYALFQSALSKEKEMQSFIQSL